MTVNHADRLSSLSGDYIGKRHLSEQARQRLIAAVREAVKHGMTEVEAARVSGVTRMTVRSWLGKGK